MPSALVTATGPERQVWILEMAEFREKHSGLVEAVEGLVEQTNKIRPTGPGQFAVIPLATGGQVTISASCSLGPAEIDEVCAFLEAFRDRALRNQKD